MTVDPDRCDHGGARMRSGPAFGAGLLLALLALAACGDTINYARDGRAINLRDCSDWATQSIPGCYDGHGGNGRN